MNAALKEVTYLYRHFDECGRLLYVGISLNAVYRLAQHKLASPWFDDIRNITVERYESREEAINAEVNAIKSEKPIHNIMHADADAAINENALVAESHQDLVRRIVRYYPIYTLREAADQLCTSDARIRQLVKDGKIGHVQHEGLDRIFITGWQLLEYVESLMNSRGRNECSFS